MRHLVATFDLVRQYRFELENGFSQFRNLRHDLGVHE